MLGIFIGMALGYNPQARLMPLVVSIPIFILAVLQTTSDLRASRRSGLDAEKAKVPAEGETPGKAKIRKEASAFIWAISLFAAIYLFGFVITTFLYTFLALKVRSRFSWKSSLGVSLGCFAFLWVVMVYGLKVDLYPGAVILTFRKAFYGY
jgi:hypothetical protein